MGYMKYRRGYGKTTRDPMRFKRRRPTSYTAGWARPGIVTYEIVNGKPEIVKPNRELRNMLKAFLICFTLAFVASSFIFGGGKGHSSGGATTIIWKR